MHYTVEFSDVKGTVCRVKLSTPFMSIYTAPDNSTWQTLTPGCITRPSGGCQAAIDKYIAQTHIHLMWSGSSGIKFINFFGYTGLVNESGSGEIEPSFCLSMTPGKIGWTLL